MTVYSIYLPPEESSQHAASDFRLVPDSKSPWALIMPVAWLAYHRLWLALLAYLVFSALVLLFLSWTPHLAWLYLSALPGLYLLLEGQELVSARLERLGWRFAGIVEAQSVEDAEIRWATSGSLQHAETTTKPVSMHRQPFRSHVANTNPGLFPE
jgi:hypothetical protein